MRTGVSIKQMSQVASLLVNGTGSSYSLDDANLWIEHLKSRSPLFVELPISIPEPIDARSPAHHLHNIKETLGLNISEIAVFLRVSRQAVYKWLANTSTPEEDKLARINALSTVADAFKKAGIQRGCALLNIKIINEQSLLDLIQSGRPYKQALSALIREARISKSNHQKSVFSQSQGHPTNDWQSTISIPSYDETL
jgi:transcriptional regulator with XRE-family HTH domain